MAAPSRWPGATIVCLGSGPSLTVDDVDYLRARRRCRTCRVRVLAINDTYRLAPWADVLYAPDPQWWTWHGADVARRFQGLKFTVEDSVQAQEAGARRLNYRFGADLSDDPTTVIVGGHAGAQAINLALHLGPPSRIVLLGYDLQPSRSGDHHFFGHHPDGTHVGYTKWQGVYRTLNAQLVDRGIAFVNASRATAIVDVPRQSLRVLIPMCH